MSTQKQIAVAFMLIVLIAAVAKAQTRVSPLSVREQSEPFIAVNPTDPNNLIIVAISFQSGVNRIGGYYSADGGQNWIVNEDIIGGNLAGKSAGDPLIAFDGTGVAYCLYQVTSDKRLYLQKSLDGGATWNTPETAYQAQVDLDRPWMTVSENPNAAGIYEIYITVTDFITTSPFKSVIEVRKSTDAGATFSSIKIFGNPSTGTPPLHGSSIALGGNGMIYCTYAEVDQTSLGVTKIYVHKSTDGGSTFTQDFSTTVSQIGERVQNVYTIKNGQIRAGSYPRIEVDRSPGSATQGTVYVAWANKALSASDANIKMAKRTPSGTWSVTEIASSSVDEWAPAIRVGPDGVRQVLWYEGVANSDEIKIRMRSYKADGSTPFLVDKLVGVAPAFKITSSYSRFLGIILELPAGTKRPLAAGLRRAVK